MFPGGGTQTLEGCVSCFFFLYTVTVLRSVLFAASTSWSSSTIVFRRSSSVSAKDWEMEGILSLPTLRRFVALVPCGRLLACTRRLSLKTMRRWSVQHSAPCALPVPLPDDDVVDRCQWFERGFTHDVLFRVGMQKTMLLIRRSCSAQVCRSSRPLLLNLLSPCFPITHSQVEVSRPTLALKSSNIMSLSA